MMFFNLKLFIDFHDFFVVPSLDLVLLIKSLMLLLTLFLFVTFFIKKFVVLILS